MLIRTLGVDADWVNEWGVTTEVWLWQVLIADYNGLALTRSR